MFSMFKVKNFQEKLTFLAKFDQEAESVWRILYLIQLKAKKIRNDIGMVNVE